MFGTIGQSVGMHQYPDYRLGEADLISMSTKPDRYSLEVWEETLNKINPNISNDLDNSPLMYVIWAADDDSMDEARFEKIATIIKLFIEKGADCNPKNGAGDTPLQLLCSKKWGDFPQLIEFALEQIINNGTEPDSIMVGGIPLLLAMSIFPEFYSIMAWKTLLQKGLNPNVSDDGGSPLTYVIRSESMNEVINQKLATIIKLLIENGADCNQEIGSGETPLQLLCSNKWDDFPQLREMALEQIINNGIEPDSIMAVGKPLLLAMSRYPDYYSSMAWEMLLHKGLDPNVSGDAGMSPLIRVIKSISSDKVISKKLATIIELLIKSGADCYQEDSVRDNALQLLCLKKWDNFPQLRELALEQIINNGIEPESLKVKGEPLLLAISKSPIKYSKLALRSVFRYGVLPVLKENELEAPPEKKPKLNCGFNDTLEKHKAHFCFRPLEYRCICAVDRYSRGQGLTMLPKSIQKDIKNLFHS